MSQAGAGPFTWYLNVERRHSALLNALRNESFNDVIRASDTPTAPQLQV